MKTKTITDNKGNEIKLERVNEKEEKKRDEQGRIIWHKWREGTTDEWCYLCPLKEECESE